MTSDKKLRLSLLSFEKDLYDQETYVVIHILSLEIVIFRVNEIQSVKSLTCSACH